jgi:hypothetical protein
MPESRNARDPSWQWKWSRRGPSSTRPRPWSSEELHTLKALLRERRPWSEIAHALKRSPTAVLQRARQHGLTGRQV